MTEKSTDIVRLTSVYVYQTVVASVKGWNKIKARNIDECWWIDYFDLQFVAQDTITTLSKETRWHNRTFEMINK
jgi:hypothetical protein